VAHLRHQRTNNEPIRRPVGEDRVYYRQLDNALTVLNPVHPSVSLTGGEPTFHPRFPRILKILKAHDVRKRVITTNGTLLLKPAEGSRRTVIEHLIDFRLDHLNISRAHFDERENARLMRFADKGVSLGNAELQRALGIAQANQIRPRLSCILLKEGVHKPEQMVEYLDWARSMCVDNVVFREPMGYDTTRVNPNAVTRYVDDNKVLLEPIMAALDRDPRFTLFKQHLGYYYYVEVRRYRDIDVVTEIADLAQINRQPKHDPAGKPLVHEMVFHPTGVLGSSWREWEGNMIRPDRSPP
jgi:organic radical activating enzyme